VTEAQAILALQNGNFDAIERLIVEYQIQVYNTTLGILQNEHDAEEVTQDVFIKVCNKISSFKGDALFSTWLYRIAINESLQVLRKQKAKKRIGFFSTLFSNKVEETEAIDFVHPGIMLEQKEAAKQLFAAIKQLPERQQVAVTLRYVEQLAQKQVAEIMELSEGAVESLLQRAKRTLKNKIN
jgi:RNA polymerase sigma-70 factor (ECF subfamily)